MKKIYSNINIIGGGLIGACAAYSLSKLNYKITILEKNSKFNIKKHPDLRTVAISEGTKIFLNDIGLWKKIKPYAEPIKKISVINRKLSEKIEFDNFRRLSSLGYIVKNKHLLNVLYKELNKLNNVKILNQADVINIENKKYLMTTNLKQCSIDSDLIVAADGKFSYVRNIFKTPIYKKNYNKKAMVLTFTHSKNHLNTAFEFFYKDGPLAILPMKKTNNSFTSSIVWTHDEEFIDALTKFDNDNIISILNKKSQYVVGHIKEIITRQSFPISAHINSKFYEHRTIYVGDSAHSFHPIAGQGWNLGMNDVRSLYNLCEKYNSFGIEIGDQFFCNEYHSYNYYNAYRLYQITDKLDLSFTNKNPVFSFFRSFGINQINKNDKLKELISDFAMGIN